MATTINSYSVGLGMDASGYIDGAKISRSETRQLIKDIDGARTPTEQYAREQDRLTDALNKGAISQEVYSRLLEKKRTSLLGAASATEDHHKSIGGLSSTLVNGASSLYLYSSAYSAVTTGIHAATHAGIAFIAHLREVQNKIDDTSDAAAKMGLNYNEAGGLRFAAKTLGGVEAATVDDSIKKMLINTAKAVDGDESVRDAFKRLGLETSDMMRLDPVEQFAKVADAMKGIDNQAEKLKLTMEIFGKGGVELVSTLDQGGEAIQRAYDYHKKWHSLTESQLEGVDANNKAWEKTGVIIDGISSKLSAEFAPAMLIIADQLTASAEAYKNIDQLVTSVVDSTVYYAGTLKDSLELLTSIATVSARIAAGDYSNAAINLQAALDMTSGEQALQKLYDKRFELDRAGMDNNAKLAETRKNNLTTDIEIQKSAAEKLASQEKQRDEDKAQREFDLAKQKERNFLELSIKQANQFYEEQKKKDEATRKEVSKGPGVGMEVGSADAARYMAEQINAAIGNAVVPQTADPTQAQILEEAARQSELIQSGNEKLDMQLDKLKELIIEQRSNGVRRV